MNINEQVSNIIPWQGDYSSLSMAQKQIGINPIDTEIQRVGQGNRYIINPSVTHCTEHCHIVTEHLHIVSVNQVFHKLHKSAIGG